MFLYCLLMIVWVLFGMFFMSMVDFGTYEMIFIEWSFLGMKFVITFYWIVFVMTLCLIVISVVSFCSFYMNKEFNYKFFIFILVMFVISMVGLVLGEGGFQMLVMWDLLGLSSCFLIMFYQNWESSNSAMHTVLTNRIGDFYLFIFVVGMICSKWGFKGALSFLVMCQLFLMLACFTKSAQWPFSGWLPKAMSAPTPVSCLVHSSTLVVGGLILVFSFKYIMYTKLISILMVSVGLLTMGISGIMAFLETDLKKIVALSTLSQLGFVVMVFGVGSMFVGFFHLVGHAFFKSCLFVQVGYIIFLKMGQQDSRGVMDVKDMCIIVQLQMVITLFCLVGLMFMSGGVSKDLFFKMFLLGNWVVFLVVLFVLFVFFTFVYCYRLYVCFFYLGVDGKLGEVIESLVSHCSLGLTLGSIFILWELDLNSFVMPLFECYGDEGVVLVFFMWIGLLWGFSFLVFNYYFKSKGGNDLFPLFVVGLMMNMSYVEKSLKNLGELVFKGMSSYGMVFSKFLQKYNLLFFCVFAIILFFYFWICSLLECLSYVKMGFDSIYIWFCAGLFFSFLSFSSMNSTLSSVFLMFSIICFMPLYVLLGYSWYSFVVVLIMISGLFVMILYISGYVYNISFVICDEVFFYVGVLVFYVGYYFENIYKVGELCFIIMSNGYLFFWFLICCLFMLLLLVALYMNMYCGPLSY